VDERRRRVPQRGKIDVPTGFAPRALNLEPRILERRPAAVLFMAACSDLTGVIQQPLAHILPSGTRTVQPDGIGSLDLDRPPAAPAGNAQHVSLDLRQRSLTGLQLTRGGLGFRLPIFGRKWLLRRHRRRQALYVFRPARQPSILEPMATASQPGSTGGDPHRPGTAPAVVRPRQGRHLARPAWRQVRACFGNRCRAGRYEIHQRHLQQQGWKSNLQSLRPHQLPPGPTASVSGDASWLHLVVGRFRSWHQDELHRGRAELLGGLSGATQRRQPVEMLELVSCCRPAP
jgi:hypothetical protein